ncbi:MAG: hypothetical protein Q9191_005715 [Dirinaria sp. TL-2023a]
MSTYSMPCSKAPNGPLPGIPNGATQDTKVPAHTQNKLLISRLTSLLLERQDLDAQLCTLEGIMETYNCSQASLPARRSSAGEPFNERLGSLMPSFTDLSAVVKPSTNSKSLTGSTGDVLFKSDARVRPEPLNPKRTRPKAVEQTPPESPNFKKTVEALKDNYSSATLRLAEIELEIELVYLRVDMKCASEKRQRREASVYRPKTKIDSIADSLNP